VFLTLLPKHKRAFAMKSTQQSSKAKLVQNSRSSKKRQQSLLVEENNVSTKDYVLMTTSTASQVQEYVKLLRDRKDFLNLVLAHVAKGIEQYQVEPVSVESNWAESNGIEALAPERKHPVVQKVMLTRLEKLFKSIVKQDSFWEQAAFWMLRQSERWDGNQDLPPEYVVPDVLVPQAQIDSTQEKAWRNSVLMSACAHHTATQWLIQLDLPSLSPEEIEKLLGARKGETPAVMPQLFQEDQDLQKVATGYPILTGAQALINSQWEDDEYPYWRKLVGNGFIQHNIVRQNPGTPQIDLVPGKAAWNVIQQFSPEAAYILLIFSAHATDSEEPWKQQIRLRGTDLIKLLGLSDRTDLTISSKLKRIRNLVELVCSLSVLVNNINIGSNRYNIARGPMWLLEEIEYSGQLALTIDDNLPNGSRYEPGDPDELYIKVRPGSWTEKFLNSNDFSGKEALCQYGYLAKSTLKINPYRHPLASKIAIFLTIMSRIRRDGRYEVATLLERLEPKTLLPQLRDSKQYRNKFIGLWDNALLTLHELGWQVEFDPDTYPLGLRPEWSLKTEEEAPSRTRPRNWLETWLKAEIKLQPTVLIQGKLEEGGDSKRSASSVMTENLAIAGLPEMTGEQLASALKANSWSQSKLATALGVDRSMVTYWIKGKRVIQPKHQAQIQELLAIS
jgi:predicted XRE-type DNA-binding protein